MIFGEHLLWKGKPVFCYLLTLEDKRPGWDFGTMIHITAEASA
jgi:hypothetical protein